MKKTIFFGNPAYLRAGLKQLEIEQPQASAKTTIPLEDIGIVVLEHPQITISHAALSQLVAHNVAVITCSDKYWPIRGAENRCGIS